jgi:hypothetical protein
MSDIILGVTHRHPTFRRSPAPWFVSTALRSGHVRTMSSPSVLDLSILLPLSTLPNMPESLYVDD